MESQAKFDAQSRAKALSDAIEKLRRRNRELEEQLKVRGGVTHVTDVAFVDGGGAQELWRVSRV